MRLYSLEHLQKVASLIRSDTVLFLSSTDWGLLAAELPVDALTDKGNLPTPQNFTRLNLRGKHILQVVNSGSENRAALDLVNRRAEEYSGFRFAIDNILAPRKSTIDYADTTSTHALDPELAKEKIRREEIRRAKL